MSKMKERELFIILPAPRILLKQEDIESASFESLYYKIRIDGSTVMLVDYEENVVAGDSKKECLEYLESVASDEINVMIDLLTSWLKFKMIQLSKNEEYPFNPLIRLSELPVLLRGLNVTE